MTKYFLLLLLSLGVTALSAQVGYTAKDSTGSSDGYFRVGSNMGIYPGFNDQGVALLGAGNGGNVPGAGIEALRPLMPEYFYETWGYNIRVDAFNYYQSLGMSDHTGIIGYPTAAHRDTSHYCPTIQSELFANMYAPIWDGGANGTPYNDTNYYAAYLYKAVNTYKPYVKYWEIWNEPGFDYTGFCGWASPNDPCNWWTNNPDPCDYKLRAPIFHYVRLLRISWDIIKTLDPDAYVCASGLGYESFLDAVLRNTDNPVDGSVTANYPHGGGAYFDCVGFHSYPHFDGSLREWSNAVGGFVYFRHSDRAASGLVNYQTKFQNILSTYGYDGDPYPRKAWIVTEANIPRKPIGEYIGSAEAQRNYVIKAVVRAMQNGFSQIDWYKMGEDATYAEATYEFQVMGLYQKITNTGAANQVINDEGKASKTVSDLLQNTTHDAVRTAAMNLPSTVGGGAFKNAAGEYTYVLWAKTNTDMSEVASATYSFPAGLGIASLNRYEWNFGHTGSVGSSASTGIALTGAPVFFRPSAGCPNPVTYFADTDGDGFGNPNSTTQACLLPAGYAALCTDCNDGASAINPSAAETADGLDNDCNGIVDDVCTNVAAIKVVNQSPNSVVIDWADMNDANNFNLQYRPQGSNTWSATIASANSFTEVSGLSPQLSYEVRMRTRCNGTFTLYNTTPFTFTTMAAAGTCAKPSLGAAQPVSNYTVKIWWNSSYNPVKYNLRYRPASSSTWTNTSYAGPANRTIANLTPGITYLYQIRTLCPPGTVNNWTTYTSVGSFTMPALPATCGSGLAMPDVPTTSTSEGLTVSPNPTRGSFRIAFEADVADIEVLDVQGRVCLQLPDFATADEADISHLPAGLYLVAAHLRDGRVLTTQVMKVE